MGKATFPLTPSEVDSYAERVDNGEGEWIDDNTVQLDTGAGLVELHEEEGHFQSGSLSLDDPSQ